MYTVTPKAQTPAAKTPDAVPRYTAQYPKSGVQVGNYSSRPPIGHGRSNEERNRLVAQGRCLGCEELGHMYAECPKNKNNEGKQNLLNPNAPAKAPPRVHVIQLYEEEEEQTADENAEEEPKNGSATLT